MKRVVWLSIVVAILSFFVYLEYRVSQLPVPMIVVDENVVLMRTGGDMVWGMGNIDSPRARAMYRSLLSFFTREEIYVVWDVPLGEKYRGEDFGIQRVSPNLVRSIGDGGVVWWIGEDFDIKEKEAVVGVGIDLDSAFWVMINNRVPDFLPVPKEGILFAGSRTPSKKTLEFARAKKIPLISVKETNGFMFAYDSAGEWSITTRN